MQIGIQTSGFRTLMRSEDEVYYTFRRIGEMGISVVQNQWTDPGIPDETIKRAMDLSGVRCISLQEKSDAFLRDPERYLKQLTAWGCSSLTLSSVPQGISADRFIDVMGMILGALHREGMELMFHPLAADLNAGIHTMLLESLPELKLLPDLFHVRRAGLDPVRFLKENAERIRLVHLKQEGIAGVSSLVPLGSEGYDWLPILQECLNCGIHCILAEQETYAGEPFTETEQSVAYLKDALRKAVEDQTN